MACERDYLAICYSAELVNGQAMYVSSNCLPVKAERLEPAGLSFHTAALKLSGLFEEEKDAEEQVVLDEKNQTSIPYAGSYSSKGKKKSGADGKQQDHYALLGLSHLRFLANEDQIKKSYRETALKYHPDKQAAMLLAEETEAAREAKKEQIENHFKAIQEAYEILTDPVRRRIYDSTDEFDDEVPSECAPADFYKVFGPVFMRNARWSVNQPVPSLGDDSTRMTDVDSFYDFWYSFKSWREFPHADEFDLEQAESRDHKRWMERQNAKLSEKARKEEHVRVRMLVDNAYKRDPRIVRRKEEEKAEKQRRRESKILAKKLQEEEAARAAEEEKRRKEEDEKRSAEAASLQKKQKEKEKKLLRKERTRLRTLSSPITSQSLLGVTEADVENLCMTLDMDGLKTLCNQFEQKVGIDQAKLLKATIQGGDSQNETHEESSSQENGAVDQQSNGSSQVNLEAFESNYTKKEKQWSKEEIELLRKGVQKYPKGTSRRWEVISEYIGTGRSVDEILKATKTVLLQKPDSTKAFDSFLEKRKPALSIASPLSSRDESELTSGVGNQNNTAPQESNGDNSNKSSSSSTSDEQSAAEPASNGNVNVNEVDAWTATQERALVQALKTFPKEVSQRWERVAAAVPGKTVNQCKKKFALMKESFRSKKNTE